MSSQRTWMSEWTIGIWNQVTQPYKHPSFVIPTYLGSRYSNAGSTGMPAGPYVDKYSVYLTRGPVRSELGEYPMRAQLTVKWKPEIQEAITNRNALFGSVDRQILDSYHSQAAFACNALLLNELQRKINRAKMGLDDVIAMRRRTSTQWDDLVKEIHQIVYDGFRYDPYAAEKYIKEHATSVVIPGTIHYKSRRWSQLLPEEIVHLFNLCKSYVEDLLKRWDELVNRTINPDVVGRGIRARSAEIGAIEPTYDLLYDRSRQVAYIPFLSGWGAFMTDQVKDKIYNTVRETAERILGCKVLLPPIERGAYWKKIMDSIDKGHSMVNGDGSNWETYSATLTGLYCQAVNDGIPQYMSGAWMTSINGTIATLRSTEARVPRSSRLETIGALGDDEVLIGPSNIVREIKEYPGIWEIDPIGTKYRVILGMICMKDRKGTFPGLYRITVDRGDKKIPMILGQEYKDIAGSMNPDSYKMYREIMEQGTMDGNPVIDYIARREFPEFWDLYRSDRDKTEAFTASLGYVFEALPESAEFEYDT